MVASEEVVAVLPAAGEGEAANGALRAWFVDAIGCQDAVAALEHVLAAVARGAERPAPRAQVAAILRDLEVTGGRLCGLSRGASTIGGRRAVSGAVELGWAVEHIAREGLGRLQLSPQALARPDTGLRETFLAREVPRQRHLDREHIELVVRSVFEQARTRGREQRQPSPVAAELAAAERELRHLAAVARGVRREAGDGLGEPPAAWRDVVALLPEELERLATQAGEGVVVHG